MAKEQYPIIWDQIEVKKEGGINPLKQTYEFGSMHLTKMVRFLKTTDFNNQDFQYFLNLPPYTVEGETDFTFRVRRRFVKQLEKNRTNILNFVRQQAIKKAIDTMKKKKQEVENG